MKKKKERKAMARKRDDVPEPVHVDYNPPGIAELEKITAEPIAVGDLVVGLCKNTPGCIAGIVTRICDDGRLEIKIGIKRFEGVGLYMLTSTDDEATPDMVKRMEL